METLMEIILEKVKKHFSKRRNIIVWIIVISLTIVSLFFCLIYTKDSPAFIPEETRGEIRESIKESVAKPIKSVSLPIGEAIEDVAYDGGDVEANEGGEVDPIKGWSTYVNEEYGFSLKYPEGWGIIRSDQGIFSIAPDEDSYSGIGLFLYPDDGIAIDEWWEDNHKDSPIISSLVEIKMIGSHKVYVFKETSGMMSSYYVLKFNKNI